MMYQFEEPFVVDYGKFAQAFGNQATPLPAAIQATVAWWRQNDNLPSWQGTGLFCKRRQS